MAADEFARLEIKGTGPEWFGFTVSVDGRVLPVLRVTLDIDGGAGKCQATIVVDEFYLDATDVPVRVVTEARP